MSKTLSISSENQASENSASSLQTTSVDLVSGLLLSLVIMVGLGVGILSVVFYISTMRPTSPLRIVLEEEKVAGRGDHAAGYARDMEAPGSEEVEQLSEPSLEQSLQAVSDAIVSLSASLDTIDTGAVAGDGKGRGDSRPPGPEGEGDNVVPRFERWILKFNARDSKGYAEQLEFFKIELAAIGGGQTSVDYIQKLTSTINKRTGPADAEKRLYFMNRNDGPLSKYERDFFVKAGIPVAGRIILKLIPKEIEDELAMIEQKYAMSQRGGKQVPVKELAKTIFEVQPTQQKGGFEFVVIEQRYRSGK